MKQQQQQRQRQQHTKVADTKLLLRALALQYTCGHLHMHVDAASAQQKGGHRKGG
jgi:hypothetical protein